MLQYKAVAKKWGSSLGFVIPKKLVEQEKLKENKPFQVLIIQEESPLKKTWGILADKPRKKTGQQIKDEIRKELY